MYYLKILIALLLGVSVSVSATTYNLSMGERPPCSGTWNVNGSPYQCYGRITLASGDSVSAATAVTLHGDNGIALNNNIIGSASAHITLKSSWGTMDSVGTNTVYGDMLDGGNYTLIGTSVTGLISTSGSINLTGGTIGGSVTSTNNQPITTNATVIGGALTGGTISLTGGSVGSHVSGYGATINGTAIGGNLSGGTISLTGGSVTGNVNGGGAVTTNGTVIGNGLASNNNLSITGGSLTGSISSLNGSVTIANASMSSGSISANSTVNISNSTIGSASNSVSISTTNNNITLTNAAVVYGTLTATIYSYGIVYVNSGSSVIGTCTPNTSPANACSAAPAPSVDHYELQLAATNLACMGASVVVRACADSASPCTLATSVSPTVTLATSAGSLQSTVVNLVAGTGTTNLINPSAANGSVAIVTLSGETLAATNARKCCTSSASCAVANSCSTTFNTAGFVFSKTSTGAQVDIPHQVAGKVSSVADNTTAYLRALQTNTSTGACVARFTSPQTVKLAYKCVNPSTCIAGETLTLNGTAVQANANTASPVVYSNVNAVFDVNGSAPIPINYSDVGQVQLFASVFLPAANGNPDYTLTGTSNLFVVKPYDLQITSVQTASNGANPQTTTAGSGFTAAGAAFKASVSAYSYTASGPAHITPNFGLESSPENVGLQLGALINPSTGNLGALANAGAFTKSGTSFNNTTVSWNEVGTIALKANIGDGDYLGAGNVIGLQAVNVGRFYPDHFKVLSKAASQSCTSFTYMGQSALTLNYKLQAANSAGIAVTNYGLSYSPSLAVPVYSVENADAGSNLNTLNGGVERFTVNTPSPTWVLGVLDVLPSTAKFARLIANAKVVPDGSYESAVIGLKLTDALDSRTIQAADLNANPATVGACTAACTDAILGSGFKFRFGRLRLDDAFGPETHPLKVNFATEYWVGNHFSFGGNDYCTQVPRAAITYKPKGNLMTPDNFIVALAGGTTEGTYSSVTPTHIGFNAGTAGHMFTAPTNAAQGKFVVGVDMTSLPWLQFDWNQDGDYSDANLPDATFTFGSYRGHDRIIYWREKLQ